MIHQWIALYFNTLESSLDYTYLFEVLSMLGPEIKYHMVTISHSGIGLAKSYEERRSDGEVLILVVVSFRQV